MGGLEEAAGVRGGRGGRGSKGDQKGGERAGGGSILWVFISGLKSLKEEGGRSLGVGSGQGETGKEELITRAGLIEGGAGLMKKL